MNRVSLPICLSVCQSVSLSVYLSINQSKEDMAATYCVCVSSETMCMAGETAWDSGTVECSEAGHISAPVRKALEKPLQ